MANIVQTTNIDPRTFVTPTSRYVNSTVEYYSEVKKLTYTTYKKTSFIPSDKDKFMVVTKGVEYRPDLVSYDIYGIPDFWWKIMEANGMKDILEFEAGANIRIPNNVF